MRRMLLAAVVLLSASVSGQELTAVNVIVMDPANIQGTLVSGSHPIPANITGQMMIRGTGLSATVLDDPNKTIWLHLHVSSDGGQTWTYMGGGNWHGGQIGKDGLPIAPGLGVGEMERHAGKLLRVTLDVPVRMRIGAEVSYTTTP
jgi:hypothetical protein